MAGAIEDTAVTGPAAEVRQVTILKCDLVGSTRTKSPLDLEGQLRFQTGFGDIISDFATRFEAYIERFEGDGAFLVFGLHQPREDAAESAIRMALLLLETIRKTDIVPGVELQIRIGLASGPIAAIRHLSNPRQDSVAGLTIDLAERLRAASAPNQIFICDLTRRLASGYFGYIDLGIIPAKGFEGGVQALSLIHI